jgi:hypothetical protein
VSQPAFSKHAAEIAFGEKGRLVPLAVMKKDLLTEFNMRDSAECAISPITREVDSYFAWSFLCTQGGRVLNCVASELNSDVAGHLKKICYDFPHELDRQFNSTLRSWNTPNNWDEQALREWRTLLSNEEFTRSLRTFTFGYILLAELDDQPHVQIIRWSQQQRLEGNNLRFSDLCGVTAPQFPIDAPSVGWGRSFHLQVILPDDISVTDALLARPLGSVPGSQDTFDLRPGEGVIQMHSTQALRPDDYVFAVEIRVPVAGYLRAIWLTTLLSTTILWIGWHYIPRLTLDEQNNAEAAITMLLVAPSLITAYLVRPGEHAITARLLRNLRIFAGIAGLSSYTAAGVLVLEFHGHVLNHAWAILVAVSTICSALLSLAVYRSWRDIFVAGFSKGRTVIRPVREIEFE